MKILPGILSSLAVLAAMVLPASHAAEKKAKFSDWDLGKVVFGEKVGKKDVKGKVVVLEYWGVKCPPCVASLPHLAEMDRENRDKGLVIIGAECQGHSKDEMKPLLEKAKVDYTIVEGAEGPIDVTGIPRVFVFGTDGELVFDGRPSGAEFDKAVKDALATAEKSGGEDATAEVAGNLIEQRAWTNASGGSIRAAVKSADDKTVTFVMANGKSVEYALEKLSEESRKTIAEAVEKSKATP
ncbi:TlpA family protein disulfide reductase [Luteolibacter arcticus]|uniref:TlpA family protein disulfide reductase n=1 Tax=Luteolibacter arcticus TaxID=1581411 RepID=A0ABT3GHK6_9BACT|nr:TlpA disulfide reductase family protein [Luteolibacter arcticus]MCW1922993.1 TlpA family protein disulfide reductase [Luteolibacter arcticus]